MPLVPFHFTPVQNIGRDPFEQVVGIGPEDRSEHRRRWRLRQQLSFMTGTCFPSGSGCSSTGLRPWELSRRFRRREL